MYMEFENFEQLVRRRMHSEGHAFQKLEGHFVQILKMPTNLTMQLNRVGFLEVKPQLLKLPTYSSDESTNYDRHNITKRYQQSHNKANQR